MDKTKLTLQAKGLLERQDKLLELIEKRRRDYAEAKIAHEKEKEIMTNLHRKKVMQYATDPDISGAIDPRTGRSNQQWTQFLIDEALEVDEEYITQFSKVYDAQQLVFKAESEQLILAEQLGISKTQARLVAALLEYAT